MKVSLCHWPGCQLLTTGYYCENHERESGKRRKQHDATRYSRMSRHFDYQSPEWKQICLQLPTIGNCQSCGIYCEGLHRHHVKPVREFPELAYTLSNIKMLCPACHRVETQKEMHVRRAHR